MSGLYGSVWLEMWAPVLRVVFSVLIVLLIGAGLFNLGRHIFVDDAEPTPAPFSETVTP